MQFNTDRSKALLGAFDFAQLFIDELGWDRHSTTLAVPIGTVTFNLQAVAEKRGMVAWHCTAAAGQQIPDRAMRRKIETQVAKTTLEHLIIFTDEKRTEQIWCWARREAGKPASMPEHFWYASSGNRGFLQKLEAITFSLAEEESLTLVDVTARARTAFDVERVTKRFFDQFKTEHKAFLDFIGGITDLADKEWYASLMLNRLMFIYFMQRKGFLNGERDYLSDRLARCKKDKGQDKFYSFYRYFLLRLFHEGLGGKARNPDLEKLLGRIPYLNGGLFERHPIEERCPDIKIPDEAFTRIFAYFDRYQWHLDERPLRNDNEINPDVLGYIFEKYINQKQMGAYYTKEDITEYISKSTIIPFLFDAAKAKCKVAFENPGGPTIWDHLRDDPDRYIYPAVKHGAEHVLPDDIAAGIDDIAARTRWNQKASEPFGLPTEIWREVVARRARYAEIRATLAAGEVREINDLITLNLDIRQFAQDVIERSEGPDLLRAFWKAIEGVTVLDPTCGSGAFLFAALNILEPLYEACLVRMEAFVADLERAGPGQSPNKYEDFRATLAKVGAHPNARYFTLKSIILNNLFGVDIMEEAVEICKLRLFLKLAAQVDPDPKHENLGIEPLPDIDFNIRAGNTLVGYTSFKELLKSAKGDLFREQELEKIKIRAADLQQTFDHFRARQIEGDGSVPLADKQALRQRLSALDGELNKHLATSYGVRVADPARLSAWVKSHQPFHWFVEYYSKTSSGGFDVIVGNPPYVATNAVDYSTVGFQTDKCGDIYAMCMERSEEILQIGGRLGMIVPVSIVSADGFSELRDCLSSCRVNSWSLNFSERPSKLFNGVDKRLTIWIMEKSNGIRGRRYLSNYQRWLTEEREHLFSKSSYIEDGKRTNLVNGSIPKITTSIESRILEAMSDQRRLEFIFTKKSGHVIYYTRKLRYFVQFYDFIPKIENEWGKIVPPTELKEFYLEQSEQRDAVIAILNSSLFFWFFSVFSDVRNVNKREILAFPCSISSMDKMTMSALSHLSEELMNDFQKNSNILTADYGKHGFLHIQSFQPRLSKNIIDKIDDILAKHFSLSGEEVDFVKNFDIKYRLGRDHLDGDIE